ncbi:MAG: hypothetical protein JNK81_07025 [Anaerolineales bacterium]|nr:hypothetical protein [Anaerolineales bacterium]
MNSATLLDWFQAITSFGVLIIAIWAARTALTQLRVSAKTDLFHRFNDHDVRKHRRWVYEHCRQLTDVTKLSVWAKDMESLRQLEAVCNSLDWAGLLVKNGLLRKSDAIDLYGDSLIRSWVALRPWVHHTRDRRNSPKWLWSNFEELAEEASKDKRFESWMSDGVSIYTPSEIVTFNFKDSTIKSIDPIA